jgi:hypothetical protein
MLKKILKSPYLNLFSGLIILITAGYEIIESVDKLEIGIHHGLFIFAIVNIIQTLPELMHGFGYIETAKEKG